MVLGQLIAEERVHQGGQGKSQQKSQGIHAAGADGVRQDRNHNQTFLFHGILGTLRVYHARGQKSIAPGQKGAD